MSGLYRNKEGTCTACKAGSLCRDSIVYGCLPGYSFVGNDEECAKCGTAELCPGTEEGDACKPGYWRDTKNKDSKTDDACVECPAGYGCLSENKTKCGGKTYQPEAGRSSCLECSGVVTYENEGEGEDAAKVATGCVPCPAGAHCSNGAV